MTRKCGMLLVAIAILLMMTSATSTQTNRPRAQNSLATLIQFVVGSAEEIHLRLAEFGTGLKTGREASEPVITMAERIVRNDESLAEVQKRFCDMKQLTTTHCVGTIDSSAVIEADGGPTN